MRLVQRFKAGCLVRKLRGRPSSDRALAGLKAELISIGEPAIPSMIEALAGVETRPAAVDVLEHLLSDATLPWYLEALSSPDPAVASGISDVLGRSRRYDPAALLSLFSDPAIPKARLEWILSEQMEKLPPRTLVTMIADMGKDARAAVYRLMEKQCDPSILPEVLARLSHPDWWMRMHMVRLIGRLEAREAAARVARLLDDEHKGVRLEAVHTLRRLKAAGAVPALCERLKDSDLKVHTAAIDALIHIRDKTAVPHLVSVLKDESEYARRGAVEVLNEVVTVDAVKDLVGALRDADWWVRVRAADALGSLGGPKVVDAVLCLLDDGDEFVRRYAVEILNTVSDRRAVGGLIKALDDPDWWVRERAVDALARTGDSRAVEPLLHLLARDSRAAPHCVRALGSIGDPGGLDTLLALMGSDSLDLRREAGEALQKFMGGPIDPPSRARVLRALEEAGLHVDTADGRPMELRRRPGEAAATPGPATGAATDRAESPPMKRREPPRNYQRLAPGDLLMDRYRIQRKVGGGGFGTVYLVEDVLVRDVMILKILSPFLSADENVIRRFIQELRLTRRISHPNVIRIHDIVDLGGGHAISMEYFPGSDLSRLLQSQGRLTPARAVPIALQICEGLAAAHDQGIIHRDVKPGNILVDDSETVKIVDFGLAAAGQQMGSRLTRSGLLIGTPEYIAPEQIRGGDVDARADIYSLGVLLYEMLAGAQPFTGDNSVNILFQHLEGECRPLRELAPEVPESLARVVGLAMAREPENRPGTVNQLRQLLAAA